MEKYVFVRTSDWTAVYIDGMLVMEGHSFSDTDMMDALDIPYSSIYYDDGGLLDRFPDKLEDLELDN